jgi:hypothetical protein
LQECCSLCRRFCLLLLLLLSVLTCVLLETATGWLLLA